MKIIIIGGGIGGLTTAIALYQKGFDLKVYEAAPELRETGAGILLASNAMTLFQRLGISDQIQAAGNVLDTVALTDHKGNNLSVVDLKRITKTYGNGTIAIHRGKLQQILLKNLPNHLIETGKRLKKIENTEGGIKALFEDGSIAEADILIGADGIKSVVRTHLFGEMPFRYSGQTCWRGVAPFQLKNPKVSNEMWGTRGGLRAGAVQVNTTETYWYITMKQEAGWQILPEDTKPFLLNLVAEFPSEIKEVLEHTPENAIIHTDLSDFKPIKTWYKDNIVLLGDAAHATTPNLGQGACQAVKDAYVLTDCLARYPSVSEAFQVYQNMRIAKAQFVIKTSYQIALLNNIGGSIGYRLRNGLLRLTPQSIGEQQFAYLFKLNY